MEREQRKLKNKEKVPKKEKARGTRKVRKEPSRANTGLISIGDIAKMAGVDDNTVHHWKYRYKDFPEPVSSPTAGDLYRRGEIKAWLRKTGRA